MILSLKKCYDKLIESNLLKECNIIPEKMTIEIKITTTNGDKFIIHNNSISFKYFDFTGLIIFNEQKKILKHVQSYDEVITFIENYKLLNNTSYATLSKTANVVS
jgi:hypothetical protein